MTYHSFKIINCILILKVSNSAKNVDTTENNNL